MAPRGNTETALYDQRKVDGVCTRCGKLAVDDSQFCRGHLKRARRVDRMSKAKMRAARRKAGQCAMCGTKSPKYRCLTCYTKWKADTTNSVHDSVCQYDEQMERIRARTYLEADGRTRYRGQARRGRQSVADLDAKDLAIVRQYIAKYDAAIDYARRPEAADVPRIQRDAAQREARGYLRTAARFCNEILVRNGDDPVTYVADDDCDDVEDEGDGR